jgi:hypothetical protein
MFRHFCFGRLASSCLLFMAVFRPLLVSIYVPKCLRVGVTLRISLRRGVLQIFSTCFKSSQQSTFHSLNTTLKINVGLTSKYWSPFLAASLPSRMNSRPAYLSETRKARTRPGQIWAVSWMRQRGEVICMHFMIGQMVQVVPPEHEHLNIGRIKLHPSMTFI